MAEMTKMAASEVAAEHANEAHAPYLKVFVWLAVLTAIEYYYASIFKDHFGILLAGLLCLAAVKAGLVGWYFMHLKFEGNWVYIMIVPAVILAAIIVLALCPDMVLKYETEENPGEETVYVLPALPPRVCCCRHRSPRSRRGRSRRLRHEREQAVPTRCSDCFSDDPQFGPHLLGRGPSSTVDSRSRSPRSRGECVAAG